METLPFNRRATLMEYLLVACILFLLITVYFFGTLGPAPDTPPPTQAAGTPSQSMSALAHEDADRLLPRIFGGPAIQDGRINSRPSRRAANKGEVHERYCTIAGRRRARSRSAGDGGGLHSSAARRRDIGFARGPGLRSRLVSRARRSVPQKGPWPGPGVGLLRRGMEVGRPPPWMGVELQWLPSQAIGAAPGAIAATRPIMGPFQTAA